MQQMQLQAQQQAAAFNGQLALQLRTLPQALEAAVKAGRQADADKPKLLVDNKGLGKPNVFDNTEDSFMTWKRKMENYVLSVFPSAANLLVCASEAPVSGAGELDMEALIEEATSVRQWRRKSMDNCTRASWR